MAKAMINHWNGFPDAATSMNCVQMISSAVNVSNITVDSIDVIISERKKKREANMAMAMAIYIPATFEYQRDP